METKKFLGNEISPHGIDVGYVDYKCLAGCFNHILCNNISKRLGDKLELVHGFDYNEENDSYYEVFQYFIIDKQGYEILKEYTDEIVYYDNELDIYVWGVTHYGTSWDYVTTNIKIDW